MLTPQYLMLPARSLDPEVIPEREEQQKKHDRGPEILRDTGKGNSVRDHGLKTRRQWRGRHGRAAMNAIETGVDLVEFGRGSAARQDQRIAQG